MLLFPLYSTGGTRFEDLFRSLLHDRSSRSVLLRGRFILGLHFGFFRLRTEKRGRGRSRGPYRFGPGRMREQVRANTYAHAVHRRKHRVRFKRIVDPQELRDNKTRTRGKAPERREARQARTQAEPEIERKLDTAAATREPIQRISPEWIAT